MSTKARRNPTRDEMRDEYDFSGGVRGKYLERYREGTNLVLLEEDVAQAFPDSASVNDALRLLLDVAERRLPPARARRPVRPNKALQPAPKGPRGARLRRAK
jgi:hypothetical protein